MAKFNFSRIFAGFMNCKRHKIKILSPLGKRADPRASRICQILSPLGFFDSSASRICSRIPLGMTLGSPRFLSRTPLVSLSDTLVRPSDARWDLENPRGLKSAEMEPWRAWHARLVCTVFARTHEYSLLPRPNRNYKAFQECTLIFSIIRKIRAGL